jgi:predicted dehydrogenase
MSNPSPPLRIGVVGLGIGRQHLQCLARREDVTIAAICDVMEEAAREQAEAYQSTAYTDYNAMLAEANLDAVSLCTPPALHAPMTEAAAAAGVHVLCEKPMAGTVGDCQRMIDAAEAAGITLMIAQKKRFHPFYEYLKAQSEGEWGPVRWASVRFGLGRVERDWFWVEGDGGGPLVENAVHVFDLLRWLMGEPARVAGFGGTLFLAHRAPQIDAAAVSIEFAAGGVASLALGYGSEWPVAREHTAFATPSVVVDADGPFDRPRSFTACRREPPERFAIDLPEEADWGGFDTEIDHFLTCVRTGATPRAPGPDCRESIRLALAAKEAIRSGKIVEVAGFEPG